MRKPGSASDPLWYKDAVIYELHVRAFFDSNNDGIGDFPGLLQKLDYLQDLGVTCLWLLPFFPSPLKDDGYDISDYIDVHPMYGTMEDFKAFLRAAHERGLQVMIELVMNHTSDQHPWFQRARQAPPGSPERDYYVWSDTDQKYSRRPHHLHGYRKVQLDVGPGGPGIFLASLFFAPARPEFRQSQSRRGNAQRDALLAGPGRRCPAPGRHPVSGGARRDQLRESSRDPRADQEAAAGNRRALRQPHDSRRGQPVAHRRSSLLRRWRRMPHGVSLSADAAHLYGAAPGRPPADHRHHGADSGDSRIPASGRCSCATTTN